MNRLKTTTLVVMCTLVIGCRQSDIQDGAKYFTDPESAVEQITVLLQDKNWPELTRYYDLSDSPIDRADLISGEFFYTDVEPPHAHPAGFWRYKHPFPPSFTFASTRELDEPGVIEVTVQVEIDQGGGMVQRGLQTFLMRKTEEGFQVMPHKAPTL